MEDARLGSSSTPRTPRHIAYFDWIRASGCIAVVLIHLCSTYSNTVLLDQMGLGNAIRNMFVPTVFARWAVPAFFMMTGALLLDPARAIGGRKLLGYIGRMLAVLAVFGLAFSLMKCISEYGLGVEALGAAILGLFTGTTWGHLWYVVALVGLYIATPFFKAFTEKADTAQVEIALLVLYVLGCVVPLVNVLTGLGINTFYYPVVYTLFYFLLGHYAHALIETGTLSRMRGGPMVPVVIAGIACLLAMLVGIVVCVEWFHFDGYILTDPLSCLVGPYALMVFMLFKRYANKPMARKSVIGVLSAHCFGIYIVHPVFTRLLKMLGFQGTFMAMPPLVGEFLFTAVLVALALGCVWLLDRLRFCRDFLRL